MVPLFEHDIQILAVNYNYTLYNTFSPLFCRAQLCHQYETLAATTIASDAEEAKYLAKRKMLGNIKFIGELGKLQIIQDSILHRYLFANSCCYWYLLAFKNSVGIQILNFCLLG